MRVQLVVTQEVRNFLVLTFNHVAVENAFPRAKPVPCFFLCEHDVYLVVLGKVVVEQLCYCPEVFLFKLADACQRCAFGQPLLLRKLGQRFALGLVSKAALHSLGWVQISVPVDGAAKRGWECCARSVDRLVNVVKIDPPCNFANQHRG